MSEARQTVAGAYDRIAAHEDLCAERYRAIHETMGDVKADLKWIARGIVSVLVALAGWALVQLWNGKPSAQAQPLPVAEGKR